MTEKHEIISKREYTEAYPKGYVGIKQYTFIRRDEKKRVIIRFLNDLDVRVDKIFFTVEQIDADGRAIETSDGEYEVRVGLDAGILFDKELAVDEKCADVKVSVFKVRSGSSEYSLKNGEVSVVLNADLMKNKNISSELLIPKREMKRASGWKLTAVAVVAVIAVLIINLFIAIFSIGDQMFGGDRYGSGVMHDAKINNTEIAFLSMDGKDD